MEKFIEQLQNFHPDSRIINIYHYDGVWHVQTTGRYFNQIFTERLVKRHDERYDQHFIQKGDVEVFCLIPREIVEPEVRTYTPQVEA